MLKSAIYHAVSAANNIYHNFPRRPIATRCERDDCLKSEGDGTRPPIIIRQWRKELWNRTGLTASCATRVLLLDGVVTGFETRLVWSFVLWSLSQDPGEIRGFCHAGRLF